MSSCKTSLFFSRWSTLFICGGAAPFQISRARREHLHASRRPADPAPKDAVARCLLLRSPCVRFASSRGPRRIPRITKDLAIFDSTRSSGIVAQLHFQPADITCCAKWNNGTQSPARGLKHELIRVHPNLIRRHLLSANERQLCATSGPSQLRSGTAPEVTLSAAATFSR
jgi:hypothetical protein